MMKTWIKYILLLFVPLLVATGCVKELVSSAGQGDGEITDFVIRFGSPEGPRVDIETKSELGIVRESNVFNIYLLIFEGNSPTSKKVYGHYFDGANLGADTEDNWWTVTNMANEDSAPTSGTIHIKTAKKSGCTIVAVANMNPNDLDVSAGLLSTVTNYGDIQSIVASQVRSEVAANSGFFLMTAQVDGVNIQGDATDEDDISNKTLSLKRLYAKVKFNVRIAQGAPISSFVPYKWQVVNVPTCSYLLERTGTGSGVNAANAPGDFFSTDALGFEKDTLTKLANDFYSDGVTKVGIHSFSFYMMENRHDPNPGITQYSDREKQDKPASYTPGTFFDNGAFTYASPYSTYVILTGKLVMAYDAGVNPNATLDADVRYVIHLGNFSADPEDFNTLRNHNYVYNIYINGASDIQAEVEAFDSENPLAENEPGATGRVVVALEKIYNSDCHYSTQVISFHAAYMDPDNISWYVETPFNPDGVGPEDGLDLTQIDYKWVEFHVNAKDASGNYYSDKRVLYKPHDHPDYAEMDRLDPRRTMYVDELVDFLKAQKRQYDIDPSASSFDTSSEDGGPKISVTAFINEYYYERNPLTGTFDPTIWKDYIVNQPMRRMHILASSARSADKESDMIGSSFTIQQRSIQSIYAVHEAADLQSAWGMEFVDDPVNETGDQKYWKNKNFEDCGNTSPTNGRLNSMKLWGVVAPDGTPPLAGDEPRWDEYLDLEGVNETANLKSDYKYLRYTCLSRNRDNNGDGYISPDEIRWYMATDIQLIGVFLGSYGIEGAARLYQRSSEAQASGGTAWRQHVVASNRYVYTPQQQADWNNSNKYPRIVWAEEGVNGSNLNYNGSDQTTTFSARCVRNLGYYVEGGVRKDITLADNDVEPDQYAIVTRKHLETDGTVTSPWTGTYDNKTYYEFDCSRINLASLREPVDHELIGHDEHSKMACLSSKFGAAPEANLVTLSTNYTFNGKTYNLQKVKQLNQYLDDSFPNLDMNYRICPEGYRLPNVREMSLIWTMLASMTTGDSAYMGNNDNNGTAARTHWSFGAEGNKKVSTKWGWGMSSGHLLMYNTSGSPETSPRPRCVRDI
ncbi:MAG: DUF4906 domain-containing protein [Bacteroidales bacterium]|nr:DUF4906 domain-containing protein [Bacteroidales bacterium]